ncbi:MAG: hypothetical protein N2V76_06185 [Methanophagales archaeon]|nr:hypothetical protein [Methanophagales archaeon]MCW7079118.1 hypothetical protein [Candidatus Methanoxibalbensis ujae]
MNNRVFGTGTALVVLVLAVMAVPAMSGPNTAYFNSSANPVDSTNPIRNVIAKPGETVYVEVWLNITDPYGQSPDYTFESGQVNITFDSSIGDITGVSSIPGHPWSASWGKHRYGDSWWICFRSSAWGANPPYGLGPGIYPVANLTIQGVSPGKTDLHFSHDSPRLCNIFDAIGQDYPNQSWIDAKFWCYTTFSKPLPEGWNLISLPLEPLPGNESTSKVLETVSYDAVYRYDASSHTFIDVTGDTMELGVGYFVHVTSPSTWTYNGTPYTQMNVSLEPGLNMIGWINCTKPISEALSSIEGKYWYVARWNATTQEYEIYNPVAPSSFNDFDMLEPTTGYWISMKESGWLNASC